MNLSRKKRETDVCIHVCTCVCIGEGALGVSPVLPFWNLDLGVSQEPAAEEYHPCSVTLGSDCLVPESISPPGVTALGGYVWISDYTRTCQMGRQACTW